MHNYSHFLVVFLGFAILVLLFSGFVGPRWWRDRIRRLNRWYYKDSSLFLPLDPYKPLVPALKEGLKHFWPIKDRNPLSQPPSASSVWIGILWVILLTAFVLLVMLYH